MLYNFNEDTINFTFTRQPIWSLYSVKFNPSSKNSKKMNHQSGRWTKHPRSGMLANVGIQNSYVSLIHRHIPNQISVNDMYRF